ncbi:MAG TPA: RNA polymerase sigma factor [Symbiobacteriaceae bacterium]
MSSTPPDEALVLMAQQGNMKAFAMLVERHQGRVYRMLYQVVGDEQDAQDLTQEAFLKVYRSLAGYRGEAAFTTWLHRLTVNVALDWLRARRRRPLQVPLELPEEGERRIQGFAGVPEDPEEAALRNERRRRLREAIRALPPDYREVVLLYHFYQLSYREIAERLHIPVRTVESRLYRAKQQLRKAFFQADGGDSDGVRRGLPASGGLLGPDPDRSRGQGGGESSLPV